MRSNRIQLNVTLVIQQVLLNIDQRRFLSPFPEGICASIK